MEAWLLPEGQVIDMMYPDSKSCTMWYRLPLYLHIAYTLYLRAISHRTEPVHQVLIGAPDVV